MSSTFYMPSLNVMGSGSLAEAVNYIKAQGFKKGLIVSDHILNKIGVVKGFTDLLDQQQIASIVFDRAQPNPTVGNVNDGLAVLKQHSCDFVVSLGGGSPHDCAKGIALVASNGGEIADYEGLDQSKKPQMPLIAINTTAGTASEMTRFAIITDEKRHVKMAIVDKHTTPVLSVNDPSLMVGMPAALTAATGMDALTHAVEAYVSTAATPITDAVALKAIELIQANLPTAVADGENIVAREQMAYAQFMAGMAFNNASLGYVHAMAHQLGGFYDLPHGVCNAVLLPHVQRYNAQVCPERLRDIASSMGVNVTAMTAEQGANAAISAIEALSSQVGIPTGLEQLGAKASDIPLLAENALKDVCGLTNPKQASHEEICQIFHSAM
ncbi:L-threonine dehydrogenase [Cognaticolwellia aestuarii]|uniref:L-threonine dehydrogenase n=1 Tax=Cognaticolwellia aestuarii TaxID=329993 RepID=UPI00098692E4|nr:L-threonine dehydrogenase [Cognaticolwellia aestuarii]